MDWNSLSTQIKNKVYNGFFIRHCYICNARTTHGICINCQRSLISNARHCLKCKRPSNNHQTLCGRCQTSPPLYQHCVAPYLFDGLLKKLIHNIKFSQGNHLIRPLTYLLSQHLIQEYTAEDWPEQLLYIPSHPNRIKERGFCQTQVMSKYLTAHLQENIQSKAPQLAQPNPIKKLKNRQAQHTLSRAERLKSPKNNYQVGSKVPKHVALFDDVMTTGSTIEECVKVLLKSGAERVDVWVIARTPDKEDK